MAAIQQFAPINYAGMQTLQDPSAGFMRGLQLVQGFQSLAADAEARKLQMAKMAADAERARQEAERRAAYQSEVAAAFANPTHEVFAQLTAKNPEQREALSQSWGMLSKAQQDSEFLTGSQAFIALQNNKVEETKSLLDERIAAMQNSGKNAKSLEAIRSVIDTDPKRAAAQIGFILSSVDPDRWAKMGEEMRKTERAPEELRKLTSEATIKEIEAQFAPDKYAEDLKKQRADLAKTLKETELTDANRRKVLAEISAIDAKTKMIADGKIPPEDRPEMEIKLNDKFLKDTANFGTVKEAYRRVASASPTAAGDLSLVFGFMKVLDPGSTVREGEQAQARNAAGVDERIRSAYNRVLSGENLTPAQRDNFRSEAKRLHDAAQIEEKKVRSGMEKIVKNYGLNPENVFYYRNSADPVAPQKTGDVPPPVPTVWEIKDGKAVPATTSTEAVRRVKVDR